MRNHQIPILLIAALAWLAAGCSSDATAPDDDPPPPDALAVATQAGYMAMATAKVAPLVLTHQAGKNDDPGDHYDFPADGIIRGRVLLQFLLGGPGGAPSTPAEADYARAWTAEDAPLQIVLIEDVLPLEMGFDLQGVLDQSSNPRTALVGGTGSLVLGVYSASFTVAGLLIEDEAPHWPLEGTLTFTSAGIEATVEFDGTGTATVTVGDEQYEIDLETGDLIT